MWYYIAVYLTMSSPEYTSERVVAVSHFPVRIMLLQLWSIRCSWGKWSKQFAVNWWHLALCRRHKYIINYLTVIARYHSTICVPGIFTSFWICALIEFRTGALNSFGTWSMSVYCRRRVFFHVAFQSSQTRSSIFSFFISLFTKIMHFSSSFSAISLRFACVFFIRIKALIMFHMSDSVPINASICSSDISCHFSSDSTASSYAFTSCCACIISSAGVMGRCKKIVKKKALF